MPTRKQLNRAIKPPVFFLCLLPAALLVWGLFHDGLGANPVETLTHETGAWGLRLLLITLAITPLRRLSGWQYPQQLRRMLGLFAFFYVVLHFSVYIVFDHSLDVVTMWEDVVKRPFITVGAAALLLLVPLAVTSTRGWMRRLGRGWGKLHRLIYPITALALLHFFWFTKADDREPWIYTGIFLLLMLPRMWSRAKRALPFFSGTPESELPTVKNRG